MKKFSLLQPPIKEHLTRQPGYSLIEIMIVLALITCIAFLAVSPMLFFSRALARIEIDRLQSACLYLQRRAMSTGLKQTLTFNQHLNSYSHNGKTHAFCTGVAYGILPHVKGPPAEPHSTIKNAITFSHQQITFDPDGGVTPGSVYLVNQNNSCLYALTCSVGQSCYIRTYHYNAKWILIS